MRHGFTIAAGVVLVAAWATLVSGYPEPRVTQEIPRGPVGLDTCTNSGCHADLKEWPAVHGPVTVNACNACHAVVNDEEHTYRLAREGHALCTFCHDMQVGKMAVVHEPLATGDCTGCHDPHGGSDRSFLQADTLAGLCTQCHEDVTGNLSTVHGPVAAGACAACHAAHSSPHAGLLTAPAADLCTTCHVMIRADLESFRVVHEPARDDCQVCHDAHASNHEMILRSEPQELCLGCHESVRHAVETAATQHAAVTEQRGCLNCHAGHASDHPRLLQNVMTDLCFECHDREIRLPDGTKLGNIKDVIETGASLHGPVSQNNCAACHQIHGGDLFRLLVNEYPPQFYAPFREESYALCFSCHDPELVYDARTTSLTNFRNGDLNLHFLHVNREKKGRTCRACHETHASNKENHIRESVPFGRGGWKLPIRFEKLDNGGRCAPGCHVPYDYNRMKPVEYPEGGSPAIWPRPETPAPTTPGEIP
jgi:predicted CXXCH cytochrome family protein